MKQLEVISRSISLVGFVYRICRTLPNEERYVLIPQMCRSAISIPSNLAEGQQRTDKEFIRFINISRGSLEELRIQLTICFEAYPHLITKEIQEECFRRIDEIGKMTYGLMLKLKASAGVLI